MKQVFLLALVVLPLACWASCPSGQTKDEAALVQLEQTWAKALEQRDGAAVGCILAAEFEDADPNGALHSRAEALAKSPIGDRAATSSATCILMCMATSATFAG